MSIAQVRCARANCSASASLRFFAHEWICREHAEADGWAWDAADFTMSTDTDVPPETVTAELGGAGC